jgi:hypothetical protein
VNDADLIELDRRRKAAEKAERLAEASQRALKNAMASTRNDEDAQYFRQENARLQETVVKLHGVIVGLRSETSGLGVDKASYFMALGVNIQDAALEMQDAGEKIIDMIDCGDVDTKYLRAVALMLQERGSALGEFGENAVAYGEDAKLNRQ